MEMLFALAGFAILYIGPHLLKGLQKIGLFDATPGLDRAITRTAGSLIALAAFAGLAFAGYENWRKLMDALEALPGASGYAADRLLGQAKTAAFYLLLPALAVGGLLALVVANNVRDIALGKKDDDLNDERIVRDRADFDYDRDIAFWKGVKK